MSKKSFKVKNSLQLENTSRQLDSQGGELYYDAVAKAFASKTDYWSYLESKVDVVYLTDMTSSTITSAATENAIIKITGSPVAEFNLHGLARNNNAKIIHVYNNTDQKMIIKHQSATELIVSNRITTPKTTDLKIDKKGLVILFYDDAASSWVANQGAGSGGGTSFDAIQPGHGFTALTPIYHDGVIWKKAQANAANTLAMYLVTEASTNSFTATKFGLSEIPSHGLTVGEFYYVSSTTAGALTSVEPIFGYSNPVLYVQDANNIHCVVHRPSAIGDGNTADSEIGAVMAFALTAEPVGYLLCDGRAVSRVTYSDLFSKIGVSHGSGDGSTTFNIPDYRGRFLRGVDGATNRDPNKASRTAMNTGGNTGNNVGSVQADSSNTLVQVDSSKFGGTGAYNGGTISIPSDGSWSGYVESGRDNGQRQNMAFRNSGSETKPKNAYVNYFIRYAAKAAIKGDTNKLPPGTILDFGGAAASLPTGYLICDGTSLLRTDFPDLFAAIGTSWGAVDAIHFNLPDLRGRFTRMQNLGTGRDPDATTRTAINTGGATGDNVGSLQDDAFKSHTHGKGTYTVTQVNGVGQPISGTSAAEQTGATGGSETRPKNAYVLKIIKM
jgi:microcystin-dependent protein